MNQMYDQQTVRRARRAVALVFAVHGSVSGSFAVHIPWIQQHLDLGPDPLGHRAVPLVRLHARRP
ncbi:hypothetical protein [Streptomyces yanii]|uniref:Uncharacterized protein n=1 Tax=Streptomyces yanii TaxID=78510 RepID=A0ABV5R5N9_9ACTN